MSSAVWDDVGTTSRTLSDLVRFGLSFATGLLLIGLAATSAGAFDVQRMSVASDGTEGDGSSTTSAVSADGRVVAFVSAASNLVPGDANFQLDVYVHDRATGTTERISVGPNDEDADGQSATPSLSADGRYVAFASLAGNLVVDDTNGSFDVFVRDRTTGVTERVSLAADGSEATSDSVAPAISADGRYVAFASAAALVPEDLNDTFDVYVHDRATGVTTRVSVASDGTESDNLSLAPRISADGSVVVFHSFASNLVADDTNGVPDVFAHDRTTGTTARVSVSSSGAQGTQQSIGAEISGDGRFVAFDSDAPNLVPDDTNGRTDVFVHDRVTGVTERASVSSFGFEGNNRSGFLDPPALSFDGRYVAFTSSATNLVPNDTNNRVDVMLRDRVLGSTIRVNVGADGSEADGNSTLWPSLSADGSVVVYASSATNLVADDLNFVSDVFAWIDTCGNGTLDVGESCDDGNRQDGDCCSSACGVEPAGQECDDGDLCTTDDVCDGAGACTGGDPVVCDDDGDGQCGAPAVCDPASGDCVPGEPAPAGTPCDDGDLCTQADTCDGDGACVGGDPVVCGAGGDGACGGAGVCDPATGACVGGPAPDGSACDDGDPCTVDDVCHAGVCEPGELEPAACLAAFQCYGAQSRSKPSSWFASPKVRVEDRFESATFQLGSMSGMCAALSSPSGQNAKRLACVHTKRTSGSERTRTVKVANALGTQTLTIGKSSELCLPAGTNAVPTPPGLDAFKCYAAEIKSQKAKFKPVTVKLKDEFASGTVDVVAPRTLCNPASVAGSDVLHVDAHLVCYQIKERHGHHAFGTLMHAQKDKDKDKKKNKKDEKGKKDKKDKDKDKGKGKHKDQDHFHPRNVTITSAAGKDTIAVLWRDQLCVPSIVTN